MNYRRLHNTSTVDLLGDIYKRYQPRKGTKVYEVERLIAKRKVSEVSAVGTNKNFVYGPCLSDPFYKLYM